MKLTNGDIWMAREPLQVILDLKLPVMVSYKIAKLTNKLNEQLKVIEDVRNGLVKKYGEPNDKGGLVVKPNSKEFDKFAEEFAELMNQEVEIVFDKVKLPEKVAATCDACKHNMDKPLEIEPKILMALEKFIDV